VRRCYGVSQLEPVRQPSHRLTQHKRLGSFCLSVSWDREQGAHLLMKGSKLEAATAGWSCFFSKSARSARHSRAFLCQRRRHGDRASDSPPHRGSTRLADGEAGRRPARRDRALATSTARNDLKDGRWAHESGLPPRHPSGCLRRRPPKPDHRRSMDGGSLGVRARSGPQSSLGRTALGAPSSVLDSPGSDPTKTRRWAPGSRRPSRLSPAG